MTEIIGNFNTAKCFATTIDDGAREQIKTVCDTEECITRLTSGSAAIKRGIGQLCLSSRPCLIGSSFTQNFSGYWTAASWHSLLSE